MQSMTFLASPRQRGIFAARGIVSFPFQRFSFSAFSFSPCYPPQCQSSNAQTRNTGQACGHCMNGQLHVALAKAVADKRPGFQTCIGSRPGTVALQSNSIVPAGQRPNVIRSRPPTRSGIPGQRQGERQHKKHTGHPRLQPFRFHTLLQHA